MQYVLDALLVIGIVACMHIVSISVKYLCRRYMKGGKQYDDQ